MSYDYFIVSLKQTYNLIRKYNYYILLYYKLSKSSSFIVLYQIRVENDFNVSKINLSFELLEEISRIIKSTYTIVSH